MALSSSICETLKDFFRGNKMGWTDTNNAGLSRSYTHFSKAVDEIVDVRVWSGIHFRAADEQSALLGRRVAKYRDTNYFKAVHGHR